MIKEILSAEGLLVMLRPAGVPQFGDSGAFEVLVPESEAESAHEISERRRPYLIQKSCTPHSRCAGGLSSSASGLRPA